MIIIRITLLAVVSLMTIIFGLPNIEQGREEARSAQAFMTAQQIKAGTLPADTVDPWGNRFDVQYTSSDVEVVTSLGSNMATPADGYDSDDVSTSMSNPPHKRTKIRKQLQVVATLALAASPWLVAFVVMICGRTTRPQGHGTRP
jgi:hypothetical protein